MKGRRVRVLIAHAEGEADRAAELAAPLEEAGYAVVHHGALLVGESLAMEASKILAEGGPVVVCGTVHAIGTGWVHRLVAAARGQGQCTVLPVRMERGAHLELIDWGCVISEHWRDPVGAVRDLCAALARLHPDRAETRSRPDAERRYRTLLLHNYDIYDWSGLPQRDTHLTSTKTELRRLYVALRVIVESSADTGLDHDRLTSMQVEREQQRGMWSFQRPADEERIAKARVPIGERLSASRRLVVLGDPGSGKSTLLKWLATAYLLRTTRDVEWQDLPDASTLPDEDLLPILVRCRELEHDQIQGTFDGVLRRTLQKLVMDADASEQVLDLLRDRLAKGRALLLVDGLDEINDPRARTSFCELVERVHVAYPAAMVVVTSRIVGYREMSRRIGRGFEHVRVADFDRADKEDFARHWCELTEPPARIEAAVRGLIDDIRSSDRIERLTGNPLLLATMAMVRRYLGRLPNRRGDLYEEAVDVLLNWRPEVGEPVPRTEALPQLEYIAFTMCQRQTQQLRLDELVDLCARMRAEFPNIHSAGRHQPEEFIRLVEQRTGLLSETGHVRHRGQLVGVFEFRHLTFQEYLAGVAVARGHFPGHRPGQALASTVAALAIPVWAPRRESEVEDDDEDDAAGRMVVPENWLEPIRLCATACMSSDVDEMLSAVLTPPAGEDATAIRRPRAMLAALCLADEPDVSLPMARRIIGALIDCVEERDGERRTRTDLVEAAGDLASSWWRDELRALLVQAFVTLPPTGRGPVGMVLGRVAAMVRDVDAGEQATQLCVWLDSDDDRLAIEAALRVSATAHDHELSCAYRDAAVVDRLIGLCRRSSPVADAAAWALTRGLPPGVRSRDWRPDYMFSSSTGWYLSGAQRRRIDELLQGSDELGDGALVSLYEIATYCGLRGGLERAHATARHPDGAIRAASLRLLAALHDEQATVLAAAALADRDVRVRTASTAALGWLGDPATAASLEAALKDPERAVRAAAARAFARFPAEVNQARATALSDPDWLVRASAVDTPFLPAEEPQVELILPLLHDPDVRTRRLAVRSLGRHEDVATVPALVACLDDPDHRVRANAARGLASIGDLGGHPELVDTVIGALNDANGDVRCTTIEALQHRADPVILAALRDRLADNVMWTRGTALAVLARHAAVPEGDCMEHLRNDDCRLAGAAIDALVGLGVDDVVERLRDACLATPSRGLFQAVAGRHVQLDGPAGAANIASATLRKVLEPHRASADLELRAGALLALAVLGDQDCVDDLTSVCARGLDDDVVHLASQQDGAGGFAVLRRLSGHESPWVRATVGSRLANLREPGALALVDRLLDDHDSTVRSQLLHRLYDRPHTDELTGPLLRSLDDEAAGVRAAAAWALDDYLEENVSRALLEHLHEPSWEIRRAVLYSLGGRSPDLVTSPLLEAFDRRGPEARQASWALGRTWQRPALTRRFVALLRRDDPVDRVLALGALPLVDRPDLCELATARLRDEDPRVRRRAIWVLWDVRHDAAREHLRALVRSGDPSARRRAVGILAEDLDDVDRRLLTPELTGRYEWRDPRWPLTPAWTRIAAWRLVLPVAEVRRRYEALAGDFGLALTWRPDGTGRRSSPP
jgi:HEAT repeat protein